MWVQGVVHMVGVVRHMCLVPGVAGCWHLADSEARPLAMEIIRHKEKGSIWFGPPQVRLSLLQR